MKVGLLGKVGSVAWIASLMVISTQAFAEQKSSTDCAGQATVAEVARDPTLADSNAPKTAAPATAGTQAPTNPAPVLVPTDTPSGSAVNVPGTK